MNLRVLKYKKKIHIKIIKLNIWLWGRISKSRF